MGDARELIYKRVQQAVQSINFYVRFRMIQYLSFFNVL